MQQVAASPPIMAITIPTGLPVFRCGEDGPSRGADIRGGDADISALFAEAGLDGLHGSLCSAVDLQRFENIADVILDRFLSDTKP